ncbi:uncharacterized protein AB675_857 [Cyphellophora attinorum]|uniref:Xylanolytic transcriptional activator regulatory domain-containing protein n=1 Tax=Cyphellophora attinorum TaxID=1664694 RepID=A0A0N1I1I2_9EURO|nr:uncharacterized protein AB675_857 [Phialophora attinorum]KPI45732.1 hypothetical protein AB675_857 [Phialophora attinorum]
MIVILEGFLRDFNSVLPLFNPQTVRRLVTDFYRSLPGRQDPVVFAAMNVVLGLSHRHAVNGKSHAGDAAEYLRRAQSVVTEVILGETHLLNIQVLLGMVILLRGSRDDQTLLILVATAMRLAHKLGLHDRATSQLLDSASAAERANVFWIAYVLDKHISMAMKQPSVQLDDDIDLDLPSDYMLEHTPEALTVGSGAITSTDELLKPDYFRARIQLASIEGGVYDYLYSTRAQKRNAEERAHALDSVARALKAWKASMATDFGDASVVRRTSPETLHFVTELHATAFQCATLINHAHAWNPKWVTDIRTTALNGTALLLPPSWQEVVFEARKLMDLFHALPEMEPANFWVSGCSYISALMIVTANLVNNSLDRKAMIHDRLVDIGIEKLTTMSDRTGSQQLLEFRDMCQELKQNSRLHLGMQQTLPVY